MATFHVLASWSEYILALVLTGTTASRTLPVGISLLEGHFTSNEPGVAAGMVITRFPAKIRHQGHYSRRDQGIRKTIYKL
jgi:ABC-type glycerol-3-phosphate transport system permease component